MQKIQDTSNMHIIRGLCKRWIIFRGVWSLAKPRWRNDKQFLFNIFFNIQMERDCNVYRRCFNIDLVLWLAGHRTLGKSLSYSDSCPYRQIEVTAFSFRLNTAEVMMKGAFKWECSVLKQDGIFVFIDAIIKELFHLVFLTIISIMSLIHGLPGNHICTLPRRANLERQ